MFAWLKREWPWLSGITGVGFAIYGVGGWRVTLATVTDPAVRKDNADLASCLFIALVVLLVALLVCLIGAFNAAIFSRKQPKAAPVAAIDVESVLREERVRLRRDERPILDAKRAQHQAAMARLRAYVSSGEVVIAEYPPKWDGPFETHYNELKVQRRRWLTGKVEPWVKASVDELSRNALILQYVAPVTVCSMPDIGMDDLRRRVQALTVAYQELDLEYKRLGFAVAEIDRLLLDP